MSKTQTGKLKTAKKTARKDAKPRKEKAAKGPGVIGTIVELLKDKPHSKDELLVALTKKFPDRTEKGMKQTINCQVPGRLASEKGLKISKDTEGRYSIQK